MVIFVKYQSRVIGSHAQQYKLERIGTLQNNFQERVDTLAAHCRIVPAWFLTHGPNASGEASV
jgi:hypothetical protein